MFILIQVLNENLSIFTFEKMMGLSFSFTNFLDITIFLIINSSVVYLTYYLLNYDFKKSEVFLRIKRYSGWCIGKFIALMIFNIVSILFILFLYYSVVLMFTGVFESIAGIVLVFSIIRNLLIQIIIFIIFYIKGGNYLWKY